MSDPKAPPLIIGILILLVCWALYIVWTRKRKRKRAAMARSPDGQEFPYYNAILPPRDAMFNTLRIDRPRVRKGKRAMGGCDATLIRDTRDWFTCDRAVDHLSEDLRVRAGSFSLWQVWTTGADRDLIIRHRGLPPAAEARLAGLGLPKDTISRGQAPERIALRAALEKYSGPEAVCSGWDSNPALVLYLLRKVAKKQRKDPEDLSVLDAGAGWGSQLLAACAAEVKRYHAYIPYQSSATSMLAERLRAAAGALRPYDVPPNEYSIFLLELGQANPHEQYDVVLVQASDLTPLLYGNGAHCRVPAWEFLRPGGHLILFVPPHPHTAQKVINLLSVGIPPPGECKPPKAYNVVSGAPATNGSSIECKALVWTKLKQSEDSAL